MSVPPTRLSWGERAAAVAVISLIGSIWWFLLAFDMAFCSDNPANLSRCQLESVPLLLFTLLVPLTDLAVLIGRKRLAVASLAASIVLGAVATLVVVTA